MVEQRWDLAASLFSAATGATCSPTTSAGGQLTWDNEGRLAALAIKSVLVRRPGDGAVALDVHIQLTQPS